MQVNEYTFDSGIANYVGEISMSARIRTAPYGFLEVAPTITSVEERQQVQNAHSR